MTFARVALTILMLLPFSLFSHLLYKNIGEKDKDGIIYTSINLVIIIGVWLWTVVFNTAI